MKNASMIEWLNCWGYVIRYNGCTWNLVFGMMIETGWEVPMHSAY